MMHHGMMITLSSLFRMLVTFSMKQSLLHMIYYCQIVCGSEAPRRQSFFCTSCLVTLNCCQKQWLFCTKHDNSLVMLHFLLDGQAFFV